ncbi:MAG: hypothetical protein EAZ66_07670 [Alphaproteobacteria bacterium]|jgi:hypothetical protein|nr:MAG: hypothetical protein EAZ66_07670 [Alphaproteobacteria bacterium]
MKNDIYTPIDWWIEYSVWLMLQYKFMMPARVISHNDDMQKFLEAFSLNGIKSYNICKPY